MRRVALITGGSRGIGFGIALELAKNNFDLAINGTRPAAQVEDALKELRQYGMDVMYCPGDIASSGDRMEILRQVKDHYGRLHVLVNNAGVAPKERRDILEATEESFDYVMGVNLKGSWFLTQKTANWMIEQKKTNPEFKGCIINISSVSATEASVNRGEYCISKAGIAMATQLFAVRLGEFDIPVFEVRPGIIQTDMTSGVREKYDKLIAEGLLVQKRWGEPQDVGKVVASLAKGDFMYSTGQVIMVDGGLTIPRFINNCNERLSITATTNTLPKTLPGNYLRIPVIVAALGYMVDMYDLFLFSINRVASLKSLHISGEKLLADGIMLLNLQMAGMLIGGIFWGIMGDKKGRLSVLFGSILIYSLANIGNGFVTTVTQYAVLRFIAGFGLAGELGAGITLVTEILPKERRGYGTTLVATVGIMGALLAYLVSHLFDWRTAYFIGGGLGLILMILRVRVFESGLFMKLKEENIKRGDVLKLFNNKTRLLKYVNSILIGIPIWFVIGILFTFSPEFGRAMGLDQPIDAGKAVTLGFTAQVLGNLTSGFLSQYLQSRKKVILLFILSSFLLVLVYLLVPTP